MRRLTSHNRQKEVLWNEKGEEVELFSKSLRNEFSLEGDDGKGEFFVTSCREDFIWDAWASVERRREKKRLEAISIDTRTTILLDKVESENLERRSWTLGEQMLFGFSHYGFRHRREEKKMTFRNRL